MLVKEDQISGVPNYSLLYVMPRHTAHCFKVELNCGADCGKCVLHNIRIVDRVVTGLLITNHCGDRNLLMGH